MDVTPDTLLAAGNCNPYSGIGDPYLPFRGALGMFTGDVEPRWAAGTITTVHARRLWAAMPRIMQALIAHGSFLVDIFVPGRTLLSRATVAAPAGASWLSEMERLVKQSQYRPPQLTQHHLFDQYADVLRDLSTHHRLILLLDDMQWADTGSTGLLYHLGRRLAGGRVLIVCAYCPEEVAQGRGGERHPLEEVLTEFKRRFGDVWIDLVQVDASEGWRFVDAFLDSEPNRLGESFRGTFFQCTEGHPLFTVELLRAMQERGDLVQDADGRWAEGPSLDWERLPAQVEAVIEARVGRLEEGLRELLAIASVEGEWFTAQVVAQVQGMPEREVLRALSQELGGRHRLVRESGEDQVGGRCLSRYQFAHALFQAYLRDTLSAGERRLLHGEVALALEGLYGGQTDDIVAQLAYHYAEAGHREKTIEYSRRAGEQAVRKSANVEAVGHFGRALEVLETLSDTPERAQGELAVRLGLGTALLATQGYAAPEVGRTYTRAYELCRQMGQTPQVFPALYALGTLYAARGELQTAREIGEQMLDLAQSAEDPLDAAVARELLRFILPHLEDVALGQAYLKQVIEFHDPQQHASLAFLYGHDFGVRCLVYAALWLWALGYPDQALKRSEESIALAQKLDHPNALCAALGLSAWFRTLRREAQAARMVDEMCIRIATEEGLVFWVDGSGCRGWVLAEEGRFEEGIALFLQDVAAYEAIGFTMYRPQRIGYLADMYRKAGRVEEGLAATSEGLAVAEQTGNRYYEVETHRLKGELLLMRGDGAEAEASFHTAIEVARWQQAKSWELRAAVSLCRLWKKQGKSVEARQVLAEIYGWFTEGFDTVDLKEAKALLDELSLTLNDH